MRPGPILQQTIDSVGRFRVKAGLQRLAALAVDYLVVAAYAVGLALVVFATGAATDERLDRLFVSPAMAHVIGFLTLTVPAALYLGLFESSSRQATPGKSLLGLQVVRPDGGRLSHPTALLRAGAKLLPWELSHAALWQIPGWPGEVERLPPGVMIVLGAAWLLVGLYGLSALADRLGRTLYDRLLGSEVVRAS